MQDLKILVTQKTAYKWNTTVNETIRSILALNTKFDIEDINLRDLSNIWVEILMENLKFLFFANNNVYGLGSGDFKHVSRSARESFIVFLTSSIVPSSFSEALRIGPENAAQLIGMKDVFRMISALFARISSNLGTRLLSGFSFRVITTASQ